MRSEATLTVGRQLLEDPQSPHYHCRLRFDLFVFVRQIRMGHPWTRLVEALWNCAAAVKDGYENFEDPCVDERCVRGRCTEDKEDQLSTERGWDIGGTDGDPDKGSTLHRLRLSGPAPSQPPRVKDALQRARRRSET